jgi:hypothetical protein
MFYDPNLIGYLEKIELDVNKILHDEIICEEIYQIMLVFARVHKREEDRMIRLKQKILHRKSP